MSSIPTAVNGPTGVGTVAAFTPDVIGPNDVMAINQQMQDALLRNVQLHDALANSIQVAPSARQAEVSGNQLQTRQNQDNLSLEPDAVEAKKNQLDQFNTVTPLQTEEQAGDINNKIALQPGERNIALGGQAVQAATTSAAIPEADLAAQEAQADPTGANTGARQAYQSLFHSVPKNQDGSIDYPGMSSTLSRIAMFQMNAQNPAIQGLYKLALDKGRPDLALKLTGGLFNGGQPAQTGQPPTGRSINDVIDQIQSSPGQLNPQQQQDAAQDANSLSAGLQRLNDLRTLVNTPGVVGPGAGEGSWLGTTLPKVKGFLGVGDNTKLTNQNEVNQATSGELGKIIESLKGIRSANIADKVGGQVPGINGTVAEWNRYLDRNISAAQAGLSTIKSQLPAGVTTQAAPAASPAPAPTANAPAPVDMTNRVTVKTKADYDALKPGQKYVDAFGVPATKPQ